MTPSSPQEAYPAEVVALPGGLQVMVRAIRPDDASGLQAFVGRLSPESIFLRTMTPLKALSDADAQRLARVDYDQSMALVATREPEGSPDIIGVARYAAGGADPGEAEAAVVVEDVYQGQGLGSLLLGRLVAYARRHGIGVFVASVVPGNDRILRLIARSGLAVESHAVGPGELYLRIPLQRDARHPGEAGGW